MSEESTNDSHGLRSGQSSQDSGSQTTHEGFMHAYNGLSCEELNTTALQDTVLDFRKLSKLHIRYLEFHLLDEMKSLGHNEITKPEQLLRIGRFLHEHGRAI
jgi:hypothetical protein